MEEFGTEFDLTNQQIICFNEIDMEPAQANIYLSDFNHLGAHRVVHDEPETFEEINISNNPRKSERFNNSVHQHQLQIIQNQNGVRYMKLKKTKKASKKSIEKKVMEPQHCITCLAMFTSKYKLKKHILQEHTLSKKHRCEVCFEEFNVFENLTLHISLHAGDGRCPQCGKIFRRLASLEGHIKTHFKNEYFVCTQGCDETFQLEWMLKQHISEFHQIEKSRFQEEKADLTPKRRQRRKNINCRFCGKQFSKNCLLVRHERIHTGQKPFECSECDRCFAQKNTLIIHQRRHSDQRMFKCKECPQAFVQKGNLISHVDKCHTYKEGVPSFPCNKCSCVFKKIGTLNAHISKFHTSQGILQPVIQQEGELGFKIDDVMQQLNELHRPNSLDTELLSKELFFNLPVPFSFSEEGQGAENLSESGTQSSQLKLAVHTSNGLVTHCNVMQRMHGNIRWYICLYCPKEFRRPSDLVRHIRVHTKEKPFECPVTTCEKRFSVKSSLTTHLNTHYKSSQDHACRVCRQKFGSADAFDDHCRLSHAENPMFQCFICSQTYIINSELKKHLKTHRSLMKTKRLMEQNGHDDGIQLDIIMNEPIILTKDGEIEKVAEKNIIDQERKFECTVCPSSFKRKGHLKEHVISHLGLKKHKCGICDKSFGKMSILNRHLLYHSNDKKFKCGMCSASFISNNQLNRHSLKHTTQRNVMCPYCLKRFKSKATCRTHMSIHKSEWMKEFKEQIRSGNIQLEDSGPNPSSDTLALDIVTSSTNDQTMDTLNGNHINSLNGSIQGAEENSQVLLTNFSQQENQITDSNNKFEYFLLLPTNPETSENVTGAEINAEADQFVINDESLNFTNVHLIQLEPSCLLDPQSNSSSTQLMSHYQLDSIHEQSSEPQQYQINLKADHQNQSANVIVPNYVETQCNSIDISTYQSNENISNNHQNITKQRTRKSTRAIHKCEICSKIFQKPIDLRRHIRTHTLEKPFQCTTCLKSFGLKSTLKNHMKTHDNIKQMFPCTVCWKAYSSRHSMRTHMLIHTNSRNHKCEYCTISFRTRGHLKIHQQVHLRESKKHGVSPSDIKTRKEKSKLLPLLNVINECTDVNERMSDNDCFESLVTVRVDRLVTSGTAGTADKTNIFNIHTNGTHQCLSCPEQFNDVNEFKGHLRTHKENFRCPDCTKTFKKPSLLDRHKTVHSGRKGFVCEVCQKSYTQKATLQAHMSLHTANGVLFECSKCRKKFNFKTNLTTHERKCNLNSYEHSVNFQADTQSLPPGYCKD